MGKTIISWATYTNNVVTGCSKPAAIPEAGLRMIRLEDEREQTVTEVEEKWTKPGTSPECIRCYAETLSLRRKFSPKPWLEENEEVNVRLRPERFREFKRVPVKYGKPSEVERFFVCSMGDIFHRLVPDSFLRELWDYMIAVPHIYMLLTKRIDRAASFPGPWPPHIWLGTTCGHPATKWRIEYLRRSRAAVRFISMEPLLAPMLPLNLDGINQVIVGGESGAGFRPMEMQWAREIRDECAEQGAAFFFKQDAAYQTETRPYLVETDGVCHQYQQFPGEFSAPRKVPATYKASPLRVVG